VSQHRTVIDAAEAPLQAICVDPWARSVMPAQIPVLVRACGCMDADGRALADLLGRMQRAYSVLDGTGTLIVGTAVVAPRWVWASSITCRGFGIILGGTWAHAFNDSRASLDDVLRHVEFPRRRAAARAA
jgi:hypothetical protein